MSKDVIFYMLMRHRPDLAQKQFTAHWRDVHGPLTLRELVGPARIRGYVQNHDPEPIPGFAAPEADGVLECRFDTVSDAFAVPGNPAYLAHNVPDEANFAAPSREVLVAGTHVLRDGDPGPEAVKGLMFFRRKPGSTREAFRVHWRDVHAPIALTVPGIVRLVQHPVVDEQYAAGEPAADGVLEVWWADRGAVAAALASPEARDGMFPDAASFVDLEHSTGVLVQPMRLI